MIVNIRGTSGTGKSTVVREIVQSYIDETGGGGVEEVHVEGRRQPLCTLYKSVADGVSTLVTLGHYNTPCGGCDTINKQEDIFRLIREHHALGRNVLYEGLLVSGEVTNTAQLHKDGLPLTVIALNVPIDVCIDSVNGRRWAKSPEKPGVNPANTVAKHRGVKLSMTRLEAEGVDCRWATRDQAFDLVAELLSP